MDLDRRQRLLTGDHDGMGLDRRARGLGERGLDQALAELAGVTRGERLGLLALATGEALGEDEDVLVADEQGVAIASTLVAHLVRVQAAACVQRVETLTDAPRGDILLLVEGEDGAAAHPDAGGAGTALGVFVGGVGLGRRGGRRERLRLLRKGLGEARSREEDQV
ncbi:hypothetical protein D3C86_1557220 [compost metagenome]